MPARDARRRSVHRVSLRVEGAWGARGHAGHFRASAPVAGLLPLQQVGAAHTHLDVRRAPFGGPTCVLQQLPSRACQSGALAR